MRKRLQTPLLFESIPPLVLAPAAPVLTSLVQQQTKPDQCEPERRLSVVQKAAHARLDKIGRLYEHYTPPASRTETAFRHGRWGVARSQVLDALRSSHAPASRIERFERCGSDCVIESTPDGQKTRLRANYCGDRFCEPCCEARARKVRKALARWSEGQDLRFVTLTLEKNEKSLSKRLDHLLASFVRLREQKWWRAAVTAGAYFIEITRGSRGDFWHVHLHAIVCGTYVDQVRLSDGWRVASRGSFITHVRSVNNRDRDIAYVSKYSTKGFDRSVLADADSLIECMLSLRGRRLFSPFGKWRSLEVDEPAPAKLEWRVVARLDAVVHAAFRRQAWAVGLLRSLRVEATFEGEKPHFASIDNADDG